jgi:hypothetical protein
LPRKESFYNSKFAWAPQFYSDSGSTSHTGQATPVRPVWTLPDRLQDAPPVRPSRDTGLSGGVSLIGLVPKLGANTVFIFFCASDIFMVSINLALAE